MTCFLPHPAGISFHGLAHISRPDQVCQMCFFCGPMKAFFFWKLWSIPKIANIWLKILTYASVTVRPTVRPSPHLLWRSSNNSWLLSSLSANGDLCRIETEIDMRIERGKVKSQKIPFLRGMHIYSIGLLKTAFADLVVAVYRCNLQSIWHRRWLGNLKHSKCK